MAWRPANRAIRWAGDRFMSLRRRLALSTLAILALFALNLGIYIWGTQQRSEAQEQARLAAERRQLTQRLEQELANLRRLTELTMQTADDAAPLPQGTLDSFEEGVSAVRASTTQLLHWTAVDAQVPVLAFERAAGELFATWRAQLGSIGVDPVQAATAQVRAEALAREVGDEQLPKLAAAEQRIADLANARSYEVGRLTNRWTVGIFLASGLLAALVAFLTSRRLTRALAALNLGARILGAGARAHRIPLGAEDELGELARSFNEMAAKLEDKTQELELFFNLVEQTDDMLLIVDLQSGRLLQANAAACAALGQRKEELIGRDVRPQLGLRHVERSWDRFVQNLRERNPLRLQWALKRRDGPLLPVEIGARRVRRNDCEYVVVVARDITPTKQLEKQLRALSRVDALTAVPNRRAFDERFALEWRRAIRHRQPLSLLLIDVDCFKEYNDSQGHPAGDACLRRLAAVLSGGLRRDVDAFARYGGEEFAALLTETSEPHAEQVAERLCRSVAELKLPHPGSPVAPWVSVSIGYLTLLPQSDQDSELLLRCADQALYEAKRQGRNRVARYAPVAGKVQA